MKLAIAVLGVGVTSFFAYVLATLLKELISSSARDLKVYVAKFQPKRKRGELIEMQVNPVVRKVSTETEKRIALGVLIVVGAAIPFHGQQSTNGPQPSSKPESPRVTNNSQVPQEALQELDAMKKRIEQLEALLKQQKGAPPSAQAAVASAPAEGPNNQADASPIPIAATLSIQEPAPSTRPQPAEPFAFADWTWLNGNPRTKELPFDSKFFTPEVRVDVAYHYDFNHPQDDTIGGSSEVFRSNEIALTHLGIGGDFHYNHVRARVLSQIGQYATATPRNDASYSRGQWQLDNAYRYVNEAYGGYHIDALHGINVDAGIFLSYVGLFSFYNFDNWAYQPSYVSSNTPWFFTGMRIQVFPTEKLKIEPWIINGWQSYARYNYRLGLGGQVLYRPTSWIAMLSNNYGLGADTLGIPNRTRYHSDNTI